MKSRSKARGWRPSKKLLLLVAVLLIAAGAAVLLWSSDRTTKQNLPPPAVGTTSKPTPHQTAPVSNTNRQGGVIDQKGQTSGTQPPVSDWVSSASGNITLQQPTTGQALHSGDTISGTAKVNTVQFILKDNSVGVIAQGSLSVVNGNFSGILEFTSHSSSGALEVYYPNPSTGAEGDIINTNVNFSS